jgi:hypothetical protein
MRRRWCEAVGLRQRCRACRSNGGYEREFRTSTFFAGFGATSLAVRGGLLTDRQKAKAHAQFIYAAKVNDRFSTVRTPIRALIANPAMNHRSERASKREEEVVTRI